MPKTTESQYHCHLIGDDCRRALVVDGQCGRPVDGDEKKYPVCPQYRDRALEQGYKLTDLTSHDLHTIILYNDSTYISTYRHGQFINP